RHSTRRWHRLTCASWEMSRSSATSGSINAYPQALSLVRAPSRRHVFVRNRMAAGSTCIFIDRLLPDRRIYVFLYLLHPLGSIISFSSSSRGLLWSLLQAKSVAHSR